jgi:acyl carrier protein
MSDTYPAANRSAIGNSDKGRPDTEMAEDVVVDILRNALDLEEDFAINDAMRLEEIPNLDSMGRVRMVLEIEKVLGVPLSMDEIIGIESVANIRDLLAAKGKLRIEG